MATDTAADKGPAEKINPADNLDKWLENREAERASNSGQSAQASPAEPTAAQPEQTQPTSWRDVVFSDDVGHEFLKGKKVADAVTSWEHAQRALKESQAAAAEAKRQLEAERRQREADLAAWRAAQQPKPQQPDTKAEISQKWFDNPDEARDKLLKEAERIADEKLNQYKQENAREQWQKNVMDQGYRASEAARLSLGLDEKTWNTKRKAVYLELTDPGSEYFGDGENVMRPDAIANTYKALWGEPAKSTPAPPIVVKPAPEPPNPPGVKKPAVMTDDAPSKSPLDRQEIEARKVIARAAGIDPDRYIKRGERRG